MPYIGNTPAEKYAAFDVQYFTTSATTSYTLDHAVANELDIRLVINNVIQEPGSGKAYTASGTTLTLSGATAGTDTMYCVYTAKASQTVNPSAGSVGTSQLADDAVTTIKINDDAVNSAKLSSTAVDNTNTNSTLITAQTEKTSLVDADKFLVSDSAASGALKYVQKSNLPSGSWTLLSTTNVSDGTSTVNMTLSGSYTIYAVSFNNLIPNDDNNTLRHAFSDDDFSSVNQTIYGGFFIAGVTKSAYFSNDNFQTANGYVRIADNVGGNNTYEGVRGIIYYANMRTAAPKGMYWGNVEGYNYDEKASNHVLTGWMDSTNICTGIAYNYDSGTFKSGQIKLYGIE